MMFDPFNPSPEPAIESDEDTMSPRERNASTDVNSMTLSSEHSFTPPSSTDQNDLSSMTGEEYREDNGNSAECNSSIETDMTVLREPYREENAEGPFNPSPGPAIESDEDTVPPREKDASSVVISITTSSEHPSTTPSSSDRNELPSMNGEENQEDNGSSAECNSSIETDMTVLRESYRDDNAEGPSSPSPAPTFESDEDTVPQREKDASSDVDSMTPSSEHSSTPPSSTDENCLPFMPGEENQEAKGSSADSKSSIETDITVLEEPYRGDNREGPFILIPGPVIENDKDTEPPLNKDASTDVNNMTTSSEHSSSPPTSTGQNNLPFITMEEYREDNGNSAETKSSIETDMTMLEVPNRSENREGLFTLSPAPAIESDENTAPPRKKDASSYVNSKTTSSEHSSTPPSSTDQNYLNSMTGEEYQEENGSSADPKSSIETDMTALEDPYRSDNREGPCILSPAPAIKRAEDTVQPRENDASTDVSRMTMSSKDSCSPHSPTDQKDLPCMNGKEYQEDNSSSAESKCSIETDMTVLEVPYRGDDLEGPFTLSPAPAIECDEDTVSPREKDASSNVNSMTTSSEHFFSLLSSTDQNDLPFMTEEENREDNGSSAECNSSIETDTIVLRELCRDENAEGPYNLSPGPAIKSDEDIEPQREKDASTDVNSMTTSLKHSSTSPFSTKLFLLPFTTPKRCREDNGDERRRTVWKSKECFENQERVLKVTLLASEWSSSMGGLSTINRQLAILLGKRKEEVSVTFLVPQFACSEEEKRCARSQNVFVREAEKRPAFSNSLDWLNFPPTDLDIDIVLGHGAKLGKQAQIIRVNRGCKWIQVEHTAPEELGIHKEYDMAISKGEEKKEDEVELCKLADAVAAVGPKLTRAYSSYLRSSEKHQHIIQLMPSTFSEFSNVKQATNEMKEFKVLTFGRGDPEDFSLKGYDISARAIAELRDKSYRLILVGAPEGKQDEVAEKLLKSGISKNQLTVRKFVQSKDILKELFCEVDLCIMPSRTEGFGLTALEAMSAGLPILVSSNSGFGEALCTISSGESFVVESEEPKEWAKAIDGVRQKKRAHRLKEIQQLRAAYEEKFSWEILCDTLLNKMRELVNEARHIREERQTAPICQSSLSVKRLEYVKRSEHRSHLTNGFQYKESSGAEWKTSCVTDNTALKKPHCGENAPGLFNRNPGQTAESEVESVLPRKNDASPFVNSMTSSSEHSFTPPSPTEQNDLPSRTRKEYREGNRRVVCMYDNNHYETQDADLKSSSERDIPELEVQAIESDEDTLPPGQKDVSVRINSMSLSPEHLSILPSSTYQNNLPFTRTTRKGYPEESGEIGCMYNNDQCETQEADRPLFLSINEKFYCVLFSVDDNVFSSAFKSIPFSGADLIIIQRQKKWSEENLKDTLRKMCGLNTRLKKTNYIIVVREKDESLTQTLEECTPGGKAYTMYVAWSRRPVKAGSGLTDVVEKNCVIFVGPPSKSATNWFVAETEQDFMRHIIKLFAPPGGVVLEFDNSDAQVSSCLINTIGSMECEPATLI
ncbi:uncharacterized protein LOC111332102 isoform X1 [Stylophora pistillata]|uniref:uncharacterized protein LOC111332102 isoform X1 n=1 Tax=Stylophora pistillata TaxID=50429 RepID=UPI000C03DF61|nr:uncharacterized protein LOC111332102 isoform X1 [Stylophora pistillata]